MSAQDEARGLRHGYIGTEHLLLGLLHDERGVAAGVLEALGVTAERARMEVVRFVDPGEQGAMDERRQIPLTGGAKRVLQGSLRESLSLGQHQIGPEHILLALVREKDGVAVRVLFKFDVAPETIRTELLAVLPGPSPRAARPAPAAARVITDVVPWNRTDQSWFGELAADMNGLARAMRRQLGRPPDTGDLLLALACAGDTLAGQTLRALGVNLDQLQATIERKRGQPSAAHNQPDKLEGSEHQPELAQALTDGIAPPEVLREIRRRLGLSNL